jgi:hypothetical protein
MLNGRQMKILGFLTVIFFIRPQPLPPRDIVDNDTVLNIWYRQWLTTEFSIYQDLVVQSMDYLHLESLSCIKWDPIITRDLGQVLKPKEDTRLKFFDVNAFLKTPLGSKINELWNAGLKRALPTTVGQVIGVYTSDHLLGTVTSFKGFGEAVTIKA